MIELLKVSLILLLGLVLQAFGVVFLSQGLHEADQMKRISADTFGSFIIRFVTNQHFILGMVFLVLFFGCLLYLLMRQTVGLVWALTSLSMVITVFVARFFKRAPKFTRTFFIICCF
ncbi:MAG: hypothetical protein ACXV7F_03475 [Methylomonas sp.]